MLPTCTLCPVCQPLHVTDKHNEAWEAEKRVFFFNVLFVCAGVSACAYVCRYTHVCAYGDQRTLGCHSSGAIHHYMERLLYFRSVTMSVFALF